MSQLIEACQTFPPLPRVNGRADVFVFVRACCDLNSKINATRDSASLTFQTLVAIARQNKTMLSCFVLRGFWKERDLHLPTLNTSSTLTPPHPPPSVSKESEKLQLLWVVFRFSFVSYLNCSTNSRSNFLLFTSNIKLYWGASQLDQNQNQSLANFSATDGPINVMWFWEFPVWMLNATWF